jgi:hypothetical protein
MPGGNLRRKDPDFIDMRQSQKRRTQWQIDVALNYLKVLGIGKGIKITHPSGRV